MTPSQVLARSQIPSVALRLSLFAGAAGIGMTSLTGCVTQPTANKAAWIGSPETATNPATTFAAVGQGGDPESARLDAVRKVTQEVANRIGSPGFNVDAYAARLRTTGDDPSVASELLNAREFVAAAPAANIQITQQTRDERTGRYATLATIDRASLAAAYSAEASHNADIAARLWNSASGQNAYAFTETLITAKTAAEARDALASAAQKIGESLAIRPGVTVFRPTKEEITIAMAQAVSPVSAGVYAESELPPSIADEVRQELFRLRVQQFTDRAKSDVDIITRFTAEPVNDSAKDARLVSWRLTLEPVAKNGNSLEMLVLEGKTGSRTVQEARQEAQRLALIDLREKGEGFLRRVLYSQGNAPVLPPVVTTTVTNTTLTTTTTTEVKAPTVTTTTITPAPPATTTTTTTTTPATPPANPK